MDTDSFEAPRVGSSTLRARLHKIIFEHDTIPGRVFDVGLIVAILLSVLVVMLDSVESIAAQYGDLLHVAEWILTVLFTIEYVLRLISIRHPVRYALSFYGLVDLLAILPTYISILFPESRFLLTIRILRILRVFRIFKLVRYTGQASVLSSALYASRHKIAVFLTSVASVVIVVGSIMYVLESPESGFSSIPQSIYWAIVTITTVGYGDMFPVTAAGKAVASLLMIAGYAIIAVPTGIVTVELTKATRAQARAEVCGQCGHSRHEVDANYCSRCGAALGEKRVVLADG